MIPLSLMLVLAAVVSAMISKRHKVTWLYIISVIFGLAATYVIVAMISDSSSSAAAGRYAYYINGVRVSQGVALLTENMALFAILGLFIVAGSVRLGMLLGKKVQNVDPTGKPVVWSPIIWVLCVIAGVWVLYGTISSMARPMMIHRRSDQTINIIVCVISALITMAGLGGIIQFIIALHKRK